MSKLDLINEIKNRIKKERIEELNKRLEKLEREKKEKEIQIQDKQHSLECIDNEIKEIKEKKKSVGLLTEKLVSREFSKEFCKWFDSTTKPESEYVDSGNYYLKYNARGMEDYSTIGIINLYTKSMYFVGVQPQGSKEEILEIMEKYGYETVIVYTEGVHDYYMIHQKIYVKAFKKGDELHIRYYD